ncbi:MAG: radical SAM protein [Clostridia bacterium]|nr:radical SAM protein [Clostridia bacterium]
MKKIKSGLLCLGVSASEETGDSLVEEMPYFFKKGFSHSVHAQVFGANIALSVSERFSEVSPYRLEKVGESYCVTWEGGSAPIKFFPRLPQTGTVVDELAKYHSPDCITLWPSTSCCYDKPGLKCKFCSLMEEDGAPVPIDELASGLKSLYEKVPHAHALNFSGATYQSPDAMADYWIALTKKLREFFTGAISIEFAPPANLDKLSEMKKAGVTNVIMNLEISNPALRKEICPGKGRITYEHYYKAYERAVELFGRGQVSSVLIAGLQPYDDIVEECRKMTKIGVFPTIMPFRPFDDAPLSTQPMCDPAEYIRISELLGQMLREENLAPSAMQGCTKCGGCSLENDCYYHPGE